MSPAPWAARAATVLLLFGLAACGSRATVVLLPEADGSVGQVTVSGAEGTQVLDKAFTQTAVGGLDAQPSAPEAVDEAEVAETYAAVLAVEPKPPAIFRLEFGSGSAALSPAMNPVLADAVAAARERAPVRVSVIGHSDRSGSRDYNLTLSLRRAEAVAARLIDLGVDATLIDISSHGENNPVVPTADGVAEPRNRRVEVMVK